MPAPQRLHSEYVELVLREVSVRAQDFVPQHIYIGGGSPSALSTNLLKNLLSNLRTTGEFTMEWNPEQVTDEKIKLALDSGINRFSLGVQSLNDNLLKMLGRRHSAKMALNALEKLNTAFGTGSCDLMFCLPNQSAEDFLNDVKALINMDLKHISFYGLTLKKHSKLPPQPEDLYPEMYLKATEILQTAGLHRYEVSNFAKPGHESKHNLVYWKRGPYLGVGPSAHSCLNGIRSYLDGKYLPWKKWVLNGCQETDLTQDIPDTYGKEIEAIWLALRTKEGLSLKEYKKEFGREFDLKKAECFIKEGWMAINGDFLALNGEGWLWLDKILLNFLA